MKKKYSTDLVSVVVPSYNHEKYIENCIVSIVSQTYKNIQLIVIDDGSTDESTKVLKSLRKIYKFELYIQKNIGLPATLNKALTQYVNGEYFSICASDDYWDTEKISKLVACLKKNTSQPMCFCKTIFVDENNVVQKKVTNSSNKNLKGGNIFSEIIKQKFHFLPGLVRTCIYNDIGLYDEHIWTEDFSMNLKVSKKYSIGFVDEYLNYYRFPSNFSNKIRNDKVAMSHRLCIDLYKDAMEYSAAIREWNYRNFVWFSGVTSQKKIAVSSMINSIRCIYRPAYIKAVFRLVFLWR